MFPVYPYINLNDLNLDYILKKVKELNEIVTNFVTLNAVKYADPIQWNINTQSNEVQPGSVLPKACCTNA